MSHSMPKQVFYSFLYKLLKKNSASYEYLNKSANRGAQFVHMRISSYCWKTWSPKTKNSGIILMSIQSTYECNQYGF